MTRNRAAPMVEGETVEDEPHPPKVDDDHGDAGGTLWWPLP